MSKRNEFIDYVKNLMDKTNETVTNMPEGVKIFWESLCDTKEVEKPLFTENGKLVIQFMKNNADVTMWKAKDMAEGLGISSRTVSGAMRKLVDDKFVEKVGTDPTIYSLTEKGLNIEIN